MRQVILALDMILLCFFNVVFRLVCRRHLFDTFSIGHLIDALDSITHNLLNPSRNILADRLNFLKKRTSAIQITSIQVLLTIVRTLPHHH